MKKLWTIIAVIICVSPLSLMRCANPNGGNGSDVGNARVTAMLYNSGGTPAVNAKVCFYPHDNDPRPGKGEGSVDSTTTDANGNYTAELDSGTYNILATLGNNATFQDSVVVTQGDTTKPLPDTLKALGSISGQIKLQGTDDPRTVFILFMGSNTFAAVMDTQGNFSVTDMAKGKYRVRILTTLDNYKVMDTLFGITAGVDSVIAEPIRLEYTGIPVVEGVRIEYDTMKQIVTLIWDKADPVLVNGYYVYRRNVDSNTVLARINTSPIVDTVYRDSTGVQDQTYEYWVAAVDASASEGTKSVGVGVKVVGAYLWIDTVGVGRLTYPGELKIDSKGRIIVPNIDPTSGKHNVVIFDSTFNYVSSFGEGLLSFPASVAIDSNDNIYIGAQNGVFKFNPDGEIIDTFFINSSGSPNPYLAISGSFVYVSVGGSGYIRKYSLLGDSIAMWGGIGSTNGQFIGGSNVGITILNSEVLVCDQQSRRIQSFGSNGVLAGLWTTPFSNYTDMQPIRIYNYDNHLYIVTQSPNKILIFSQQKEYLGEINFEAPEPDIYGASVAGNIILISTNNYVRVYTFPTIK